MHHIKKMLFTALAAVGTLAAHAQQPHSLLVYGTLGYDSYNSNASGPGTSSTNTNFTINPGIGYQFNKHLTVGVQGGYNYLENNIPTSYLNYVTPNTTTSWTAGAFFRYTCPVGKIFFFYTQLNASYLSEQDQIPEYYYYNGGVFNGANTTVNANGFQAQLFPAVGINVWRGLALNFSMGGVNFTSLNRDGINGAASTNSNDVNITIGQQVNIGVSKYFNTGEHHHIHHRRAKHMHHDADGMEYHQMDLPKEDDDDAPKMHHKKHHKDDDADDDDTAPKHKKHHDDDDE